MGPAKASGLLLLGSLFTLITALLLLVVTGAADAFGAALDGSVAEWAPHATAFRTVTFLYAGGWLAQFLGLMVLARLLDDMGDRLWGRIGLGLAIVATLLGILEATFQAGMTPTAAAEAASTGQVAAIYTAMRSWVSAFKWVYLVSGLLAHAGYGAALLRTPYVPSGVAGFAVAWSCLWLLALVFGVGAPAVLFVAPALIGMALISRTTRPGHAKGESDG